MDASSQQNIEITKVWVGGPSVKPDIEVQLYANGVAVGQPVVLENGITAHTFANLPVYDSQEKEITYTVDEVKRPDHYFKKVEGFTITNTFESAQKDIDVTKVWVGGPAMKPDIEIQLYANGAKHGQRVTLSSGTTSYTFEQLPILDNQGTEINYTVDEVTNLDSYTKTIDGFTITNTFASALKDIDVTKVWVGGPAMKPDIEIQLYANGAKYGQSVTLSSGTTSYTFANCAVLDETGKEIIYTVDEINVSDKYTKKINGMVITNTFIVEKEVPEIEEGTKGPVEPAHPGLPSTGVQNHDYIPMVLIAVGLLLIAANLINKKQKDEN